MWINSKVRLVVAVLGTAALDFLTLPVVVAGIGERAVEARLQCDNPDILARFVATRYPQDMVLIERALREGVCLYSSAPTPVTPVHFVSPVTAGKDSADSTAHIWMVRLPDGLVAYTFVWSAEHDAMLESLRPLEASVAGTRGASDH